MDADFEVQVAAGGELKDYINYYKDITMFSHTSLLYGAYFKEKIEDSRYQTKENEERLKRIQEMAAGDRVPWVLDYVTKQFGGSVALFTSNSVEHLQRNLEWKA